MSKGKSFKILPMNRIFSLDDSILSIPVERHHEMLLMEEGRKRTR